MQFATAPVLVLNVSHFLDRWRNTVRRTDKGSFQSLFQCGRVQLRQVELVEAVFVGEDEGFGQAVAGDDLALLLCVVQKFPGPGGGGGVVQVEDADDAAVPDRPVVADGEVHLTSPG